MQTDSINVVIWSQTNCAYCNMAKQLLANKNIDFEERMIGQDEGNWSKEALFKAVPNARSVPQIVINDVVIGGYKELLAYFNDNSKNT